MVIRGNTIDFYHHEKIAIGNLDSGKIDEFRSFVAYRYPQITSGNMFYLGSLTNDRLFGLMIRT